MIYTDRKITIPCKTFVITSIGPISVCKPIEGMFIVLALIGQRNGVGILFRHRAEMHRLDSGHFAVEDCLEEISNNIVRFYEGRVAQVLIRE
jgi:hypothetical protein